VSPRRRDGLGAYGLVLLAVAGTAAILTLVVGQHRRTLYSTAERFDRHIVRDALDPVGAVERGVSPGATNAQPGTPSPAVRAIVVVPGRVALLAGGKLVRTIATGRRSTTLDEVVHEVADPRWIASSGHVVTARAAVYADAGATLVVSAPAVRTLQFARRPGLFLGARRSTLRIDGVEVRPAPAPPATRRLPRTRPFVAALRGSTMTIRGSSFHDLGYDWNSSYGVTWGRGSRGSVTGSTFSRCYIAVYTDDAHRLLVRRNHLSDNTLYGIDPHSGSSDVVVEGNVSERNGRHGIIFSQGVTRSVIRDNVVRGNHLNGIMLDAGSTRNVVSGNVATGNRGDGIVLANSSHNRIAGNRVVDNRIGVAARGSSAANVVAGNTIAGNVLAGEGVRLAGNSLRDNGGQWSARTVEEIWLAALGATLALFAVTWLARRSRRSAAAGPVELREAGYR
jgi:poly(beta-D-mannuronate) C5 epimerase